MKTTITSILACCFLFLISCTSENKTNTATEDIISQNESQIDKSELIESAKQVIKSHEDFVKGGNLDGILSNVTEDIVLLAPNTPIIEGEEACKKFYSDLLASGDFEFSHDMSANDVPILESQRKYKI